MVRALNPKGTAVVGTHLTVAVALIAFAQIWAAETAATADDKISLQFEGYITSSTNPTRFAVRNDTGSRKSTWVSIHGHIDGFELIGFDPATEALSVERNGNVYVLTLPIAKRRKDVERASEQVPGELPLPREQALQWFRDNVIRAARWAKIVDVAGKWGEEVRSANERLRQELATQTGKIISIVEYDNAPFFVESTPYGAPRADWRPLLKNLTDEDVIQLTRESADAYATWWMSMDPRWQKNMVKYIKERRAAAGLSSLEAIGPSALVRPKG